MQDRNAVVRDTASAVPVLSLVSILVIAALVALFVWQPWNVSASHSLVQQEATTSSIRSKSSQ